jgi:hypothetical protein
LDWLGRKLSFLRRNEYEIVSNKTAATPNLWGAVKVMSWSSGIGALLGAPGALFRYTASKVGNSTGRHEKRSNHIIANYSTNDDDRIHTAPNLNLYTLNIACLSHPKWVPGAKQINRKILRSNAVRAHEIADRILQNPSTEHMESKEISLILTPELQARTTAILQKNAAEKNALDQAPAILSFQEAFDENSRNILIARLKDKYPYVVHHVGSKFLNAGSGLMVFSQYPIVDAYFQAYTNTMLGEESLANKGFLGVKVKVNSEQYVTVYNSHTQSGGGIFKRLSNWWNGTTSARRGVEFGEISDHMQRWENTAPTAEPYLAHAATFLTGDLNTSLHDKRRMLAESAGTSACNGFNRGQIKYPGQNALFKRFYPTIASNFIDTRETVLTVADEAASEMKQANSSAGKHQGKQENPDAIAIQQCANLFTGTAPKDGALEATITTLSDIPNHSSKPKIIDAMLLAKSDRHNQQSFFSRIESVGNSSDHHAIRGSYQIDPARLAR